MNSIEIYEECGTKAGKAARRKDMATVRFHQTWFNRAMLMEPEERRTECRKSFSDAYREEAAPTP
jgi:hypothetical protein